jgi:MFS family permease
MPSTGGLIMGTIPSETVPTRSISTAIGIIVGLGVLVGGLVGPTFAGWCADHWGLRAPLLLQAGCAVVAAVASVGLRETAPRKVKGAFAESAVTR